MQPSTSATQGRVAALGALGLVAALVGCPCLPACNPTAIGPSLPGSGGEGGAGGPADLAMSYAGDLAGADLAGADSQGGLGMLTPCGDTDPGCMLAPFGPPAHPFPLQNDPQRDPREQDNGVGLDPNGWIGLSSTSSNFNFLWLANYSDWNAGTVSKVDSTRVKEVARYFTVTCSSNPTGSRAACDGNGVGCCARDDYDSFAARRMNGNPTPHQQVQLSANAPSRTAVDWNGDVWVGNRAFGGQASVTKIAHNVNDCIERNGVPAIQTSSDVNGDGVIDTDCNGNKVPDDLADVQAAPCKNGQPQEFYGLDDECVLLTTNINVAAGGGNGTTYGRPLTLGRGSVDFGPSDAWAGSYQDGKFFRIDGLTGKTKESTQVPNAPGCYGAVVDAGGILWVTYLGAGLSFFDTGAPAMVGTVRGASGFSVSGYGISLDRDGNVWSGGWGNGGANRYTPDRSNGFGKLGQGFWTFVSNVGGNAGASGSGRGIAADSRTMNSYFAWMARDGGWIARIDASAIPVPAGADKTVDGSGYPALQVAGSGTIGAGVDTDQNIWGISLSGSVGTRIKVDNAGTMTKPDIAGGNPGSGCPVGAGDRCALQLGSNPDPQPYTYSDFTGFGLRNFTNPHGSWSWVQKGCDQGDTRWNKVDWDADVPPNTKITMRARTGMTPMPDNTWGAWSGDYAISPADLRANPPLLPNPAKYFQLEFDFSTMDKTTTPKLKSFNIYYVCLNGIG